MLFFPNQLDRIAVRISHEGDHRRAGVHGGRFPLNRSATLANLFHRLVDIIDFDRKVPETIAPVVAAGSPVVGQFESGVLRLVSIPEECEGELPFWKIFPAQQFHSENDRIKMDRRFEVADTEHSV
jgi:hypothetical protein